MGMASKLETIPGIGPAKRKLLLKAFGNSIDSIRQASIDELVRVKGISETLALTIKEQLNTGESV
jgi:excinuclease ABC subunit C